MIVKYFHSIAQEYLLYKDNNTLMVKYFLKQIGE